MKTKSIIFGVIVAIIAFLSASCSSEQVAPVKTGTDYSFLIEAQGDHSQVYKGTLSWDVSGKDAHSMNVTSHSFSSRFSIVESGDVFNLIADTDLNVQVTITKYSDNTSKVFNLKAGQLLQFKK
jgi:hypothetical protein